MKALTIKQPWASLIAHGIKDIENRTWKTNYRGRIYVHVAEKPTKMFWEALTPQRYKIAMDYFSKQNNRLFYTSAIIGEVDIVDCILNHHSTWADKFEMKQRKQKDGSVVSVQVPVWNWVLANPVIYDKPILDVKGKLSFWEY